MSEYKGLERRSVPREGGITDEQAAGALERVLDKASFSEGDEMKALLRGRLAEFLPAESSRIDGVLGGEEVPTEVAEPASRPAPQHVPTTGLDVQARKYVEDLVGHSEYGYGLAHSEVTDGGLYNPKEEGVVKAPTMEEAVQILQQQLSLQEVEAIKRYMRVPGLVMLPQNLTWQRFVGNLDNGIRNRIKSFVSDSRRREFDRQDQELGVQEIGRISGWKVGVVERKKELDHNHGLLRDIVLGWEQSEAARLLQLPTPALYALLQKGALLSGDKKPLDKSGWSILQRADKAKEGESSIIGPDGLVSGGCYGWYVWNVSRVVFYADDPRGRCIGACLRPAVMKNS